MSSEQEIDQLKMPIIEVIEHSYKIPRLGRTRRISALLPHDYYESEKNYPVMYLHDGQNLFDENAPFGNWAIDRSLGRLGEIGAGDVIIIAIDHGGEDRINEYLPYQDTRYGIGQGDLYIQFFIERLKPYVDKKFRVLQGREFTGIGGSSMGGLISLYAGINYSHVISKMMIFSPSLWVSNKIFQDAHHFMPEKLSHLYLYAGGKEGKNHISNVLRLQNVLTNFGWTQKQLRMNFSLNPEGTHSEDWWHKEFPIALQWLFFNEVI